MKYKMLHTPDMPNIPWQEKSAVAFTTLDEMMDYIRENSVVTEEEAAEGKR